MTRRRRSTANRSFAVLKAALNRAWKADKITTTRLGAGLKCFIPLRACARAISPCRRQGGFTEGEYWADVGATSALCLTPMMKVFASYDGRFHDGYQAHAATGGFKMVR